MNSSLNVAIALTAGLLSFLSPCVLPLVPSYLSFVTGMSLDEMQESDDRTHVIAHSILFVSGFTGVFMLLGATASFLGQFAIHYQGWISWLGGLLIIVFGLHLLGVFRIAPLMRERRVQLSDKPAGFLGTIAVGAAFGAGWTPCIGPVLGGILTLAAARETIWSGMGLLFVYSLGLAVPFLLAALALDRFFSAFRRFRGWIPWMERASGLLLIGLGLLLVSGRFTVLTGWFEPAHARLPPESHLRRSEVGRSEVQRLDGREVEIENGSQSLDYSFARPVMKGFRTVVFWAHLCAGVSVGVVVFLMSVTGALLAFQREITAWADTRGFEAGPLIPGAPRLGPAALVARAAEQKGAAPTSVTWRSAPDAPATVAFGREGSVYVNTYTGAVLGAGSARVRGFFAKVNAWHRWLGVTDPNRRALPRSITGASNLGFLFLVTSGFFLWWPRSWNRLALANVTRFRRGLTGKARDFNWHNTIGVWSVVPLFAVVLSGVVLSYRWASDGVYRVMGEAPPVPAAPAAAPSAGQAAARGGDGDRPNSNLDRLARRAESQVEGWRSIALTLPRSASAPVVFAIDRGDGGEPQLRSQLTLDPVSAEIVRWEPFSSQTPGRRARSILRFTHTGEVLGVVGQAIAGLVSVGAAVLVFTGISLALRRLGAWRGRRDRERDADAPVDRRKRSRAAA